MTKTRATLEEEWGAAKGYLHRKKGRPHMGGGPQPIRKKPIS